MTGDLYLQWNKYSASFAKQSKKLFLKDGLSDGTIFCDGRFYPIHRFVLSSCSEYFEEIFEKSFQISNKETFIIIKEIAAEQMDALLNFVYLGEVHVPQENLPQLIKAAEALKIRGLGIPDEEDIERTRKNKRKRLKTTESLIPSPQRTKETQKSNSLSTSDGTISLQTYNFISDDIKTDSVDVHFEPVNYVQEYLVKADILQGVGSLFAREEIVEKKNLNFDSTQLSDSLQKDKMSGGEIDTDIGSLEADDTELNNIDPINENISDQVQDDVGSLEQNDVEFNQNENVSVRSSYSTTSNKCSPNSSIITHKDDKSFKCLHCPSKFSEESDIKTHLLTHNKTTLNGHIQTQSEEKHFECSKCPYYSNLRTSLKIHFRRHSGEKPFQCSHCPYKSSTKANLHKHNFTHTGEKPFKCLLCPFKASQKVSLQKHNLTHTKRKPFKCPHCPYKTPLKTSIVVHLRTHTGKKPFKCSLCSYKASNKVTLVKHTCTHAEKNPFKCPHCPYKTLLKNSIVVHLRTHTGEKPFKCSFCSYKAAQKATLLNHFRSHAREKPFNCSKCSFRSAYKCSLKIHMKKTHK